MGNLNRNAAAALVRGGWELTLVVQGTLFDEIPTIRFYTGPKADSDRFGTVRTVRKQVFALLEVPNLCAIDSQVIHRVVDTSVDLMLKRLCEIWPVIHISAAEGTSFCTSDRRVN